MPLEITYLTKSTQNRNIAGKVLSSEQRTISGTSAQSGATPGEADIIKIHATEAARFKYDSSNPTATSTGASAYLAAGATEYLDAVPGYKVAGITP